LSVLVAIPARHGSTRFPGKPLTPILGRPMIAWVIDAARGARRVDDVAVITDKEEIARASREAGARAVVSHRGAASGSDRIAHLLDLDEEAGRASMVVNLQADEPALEPQAIDRAIEILDDGRFDVATLVREPRAGERIEDPDLVKAILASDGRALDFSRHPGPVSLSEVRDGGPWIHVGIYAYRRSAFDLFAATRPSTRELSERLEQLRALDLGLAIGCAVVRTESIGVDAPDDVRRAEAALRRLDAARARP
jgi:3-deoxy-manno-octulosonate cytidylyltransferase (CMP-KDO synthetase)